MLLRKKYICSCDKLFYGLIFFLLSAVSCYQPVEAGFLGGKSKVTQDNDSSKTTGNNKTDADSEEGSAKANTNVHTPYIEEAVKHYNHGVELHQAGFLNQAIGEYKAAIEADNRMEEAYSNIGIIYAAQHNYPHAKEAFEQALKLKPNRPTTLNGLGTVLYAQGQTTQAMEKWKEALASDPKFASALYNIGNAYEGQKNYIEAKVAYLKAINVMPTMADAYFRLGNILIREHHLPQAELLLNKAIELAPDGEFVREAKHSLSIIANRFEKSKTKSPIPHKKQ